MIIIIVVDGEFQTDLVIVIDCIVIPLYSAVQFLAIPIIVVANDFVIGLDSIAHPLYCAVKFLLIGIMVVPIDYVIVQN